MAYKDILRNVITTCGELQTWLTGRVARVAPRLEQVIAKYPMQVNTHYFGLIEKMNDGVWKQAIPDVEELEHYRDLIADPLDEEGDIPLGRPCTIIHRYPDRVLLFVSIEYAMYCRFCNRKRKVGDDHENPSLPEIMEGIEYIAAHENIRDALISGGEPLLVPNSRLDEVLGKNTPRTMKEPRFFMNTHFNHPNEITEESFQAVKVLRDLGMPIGNQTVLLKGVNDEIHVMKDLMHGLGRLGVKPKYL
jgi:lysine 2,3-aminomutase